jgi:short-subunit dehydrogenase
MHAALPGRTTCQPSDTDAGDLSDRLQVERLRQELADDRADATLLLNAAGRFVPKPFLDHDGPDYGSYLELNRDATVSPIS